MILFKHRDYMITVDRADLERSKKEIEGDVEDAMGWRCYAETLKKEGFKLREVK